MLVAGCPNLLAIGSVNLRVVPHNRPRSGGMAPSCRAEGSLPFASHRGNVPRGACPVTAGPGSPRAPHGPRSARTTVPDTNVIGPPFVPRNVDGIGWCRLEGHRRTRPPSSSADAELLHAQRADRHRPAVQSQPSPELPAHSGAARTAIRQAGQPAPSPPRPTGPLLLARRRHRTHPSRRGMEAG